MCRWGSAKFYRTWDSFINMSRFFVFNFCQFIVLTSFLCFRNKDKLIKLWVFLEIKKTITYFMNPLNI